MCVIALCHKSTRLSEEQVEQMWNSNPHGAGIAWREAGPKGKPLVKWEKGLNLNEVKELNLVVPLPYVAHFRIPTVGPRMSNGVVYKALCHPFPVTEDVQLDASGSGTMPLLFHNGHWNQWESSVKDVAIRGARKIPAGKWSDSRAMAWMAYQLGPGILDFIDEKAVLFSPDSILLFSNSWSMIEDQSIFVSNLGWQPYKKPATSSSSSDEKEEHPQTTYPTRLPRVGWKYGHGGILVKSWDTKEDREFWRGVDADVQKAKTGGGQTAGSQQTAN